MYIYIEYEESSGAGERGERRGGVWSYIEYKGIKKFFMGIFGKKIYLISLTTT